MDRTVKIVQAKPLSEKNFDKPAEKTQYNNEKKEVKEHTFKKREEGNEGETRGRSGRGG